ncbi:protein phosphatase 2C domain-containing protein [Actinophytocola xanthii]|uniref:PPM-type phosphatase domain-containing protein n=1 Tax=Actinophytocola xanthii TaxID=1912961 RepID=A0A1Q8CRS8_9PSEU|nr:protein phosphatase 2C domain-containing protein [Actinophytocola xanthii]OLF17069.1 hypothetical protein BU204_13325 [Actinophytocola xanthii]
MNEWGDRDVLQPREAAHAPWLGPVTGVPDTVLEAGRVGSLEVRAASSRGAAHRGEGEVRQDAVAVTAVQDRLVLAAVADGLGPAAEPHRGAQLAVRHVVGHLAAALPSAPLEQVDLAAALRAADGVARDAGPDQRHRSTTLAVAVAVVNARAVAGGHRFRAARVGDSPAFQLTGGEFRQLFGAPVTGVLDPLTDGLPFSSEPAEQIDGLLAPGEALVLASDRIGVPLRRTEAGSCLARSWSRPPGPFAYLHQLRFTLSSYDDDRTAAVIWARHGR